MQSYSALKTQSISEGRYSIVPIRPEDRYDIMNWRNEQMYHLRQNQPLTRQDQDEYFESVVSKLFEQNQPNQILFSYLESGKCIGYGGLVHINWIDRNAEISFLINTKLESDEFDFHWTNFLKMLEVIAFEDLNFHKLYVYAFDVRPHLYRCLKKSNYFEDAVLKEHCYLNGKFLDVVIHSKLNTL